MDLKSARLSKRERWDRILARLNSDVTVRISALAEQFGVTTETIRRDIDELTDQGLVSRTYGGAASRSLTTEPALLQRRERNIAERQKIAELAVDLIEPGDVVMIDAGSTTYQFARALAATPIELTVLTNCLPIAQSLGATPSFRVMMCPGIYVDTENAVFGQEASAFLARFQANKAVIGAGGVSDTSVSDADAEASWIKRRMIERADRTILLLDHSKFDTSLFDTVCVISDVDDLVSDAAPPKPLARALKSAAVHLHTPKP